MEGGGCFVLFFWGGGEGLHTALKIELAYCVIIVKKKIVMLC